MLKQRYRKRDWWTDEAARGLIVLGLTIGFGLLLSELQPRVGWRSLLIALAFIELLIGMLIVLLRRPLEAVVRESLEAVESAVSAGRATWLLNLTAVLRHEKDITAPEVWLVSDDLQEDAVGGPFRAVVSANLAAGIKYVYFVPDKAETRTRIHTIKAAHGSHELLSTVFLPDSFFFLVPRLDIVIYNPLCVDGSPREAFLGIPVPDVSEHFHVKVTDDFIDRLVGTLLEHVTAGSKAKKKR